MKRKKSPYDKQIEAEYYKQAQGRQISVLKMGDLMNDARAAMENGCFVEHAVAAAIERYCEPVAK